MVGARGACSSPASTARTSPTRSWPAGSQATIGDGVLTPLRVIAATALLLAAPVLSGCGGEDQAGAASASTAHPRGAYLAGADLERQLGNAFRKGLYRLSVMTQRSEDAKDLGQPLPTGLLEGVRCNAAVTRRWTCAVRWKSMSGVARTTRYAVRLSSGECFAAGATPRRRPRYDATIRTYSVDPLNALGSVKRGC